MSYYYNCIYYLKYYKKIYFKNTLIILTMSYSNYIIFLEEKKGEKFRKMKEKEVVRYNNDLNTKTYLKNFNAVELNFFMAICSKLKAQGTSEIKFTFSELKKKIQYDTSHNTDNFINKLRSTNRKILNSICEIETKDYIEQFVLFPTFSISKKNGTLTVKINQDYAYLLNDFSNFTEFGLANFIKLSSKYIKLLYKELMQFKSTGKLYLTMEDFRKKLDIPDSYSFSKIRDRILVPSFKDFSFIFKKFKVVVIYNNGDETEINENMEDKRGDKRKVTNINFYFTVSTKDDVIEVPNEILKDKLEELTEEEFYNLEPPIPSEEEIEEYNAMQEEVKLSIEIDWLKEDVKRAKERLNTILESRKNAENRDSAGYSIDSDIINKLKMDIEDYYNQIKEKENKIEKLVPLLERAKERENVIKQSERLQTTDKNDVENKEENKIDYDVLIKNFLAGQGIDYRYVETNINFLKEKYTDEIIYKEIVRINGIKDVRANIDPKKYLIASINNLDEIKEEKKVDRKQSKRLQTINENNIENKEEIINSLFNFVDEEE
ncbi:replication protein [Fusobacterium hwasookii ChDC F128]|uniref:Replication protein n=2 Tax=Fusobacterium TaxID=848 RepID=A0ABP2R1T5_9FUSO|nr:replication protein [Fusobacterium hwasookii ChDC F128]